MARDSELKVVPKKTTATWSFKCKSDPNMTLRVERVEGLSGFIVTIGDGLNGSRSVKLDHLESAPLAIAVLGASGHSGADHSNLGTAVHHLTLELIEQDREKREKEQELEKLKAEARALWEAFQAFPSNPYTFDDQKTAIQERWIEVARAARKIGDDRG